MAQTIAEATVQWIGTLLIFEASTLIEVEDQVRKLQQKLEVLKGYLQDADANPGEEVRSLTATVRKLAFDAEDVIDTYILKVGPLMNADPLTPSPRKFSIDGSRLVKSIHFLYKAPRSYKLGKQIQGIKHDMSKVMDKLIDNGVRRVSQQDEQSSRHKSPSYPYDEDEIVVGWDKDIEKLVQVLMGQGNNQKVRVLSIMGMGGSGKTTLARKLYNHPYVKECFDCWAWVFISLQWSTQHVLSEILRQVGGPCSQEIRSNMRKEELVDKLRNFLEKNSYLVVLDDVWKREALQDIMPALPLGKNNKGSKIIITTRNQQIGQFMMPQSSYVYQPQPLDEDQGWQLLSKLALNKTGPDSYLDIPSFEQYGREMLRQCDGLPLAIVALAGILSTKISIGEWQQVSDAVRTRVMQGTGTYMSDKVEEMLALSYDDLPHYLKPCFLYLGLFPEDCQIPAGMLGRMWAAEGLVSSDDDAMRRLEELSHRFMVQVVETNFRKEIKSIRLHDLLRDLCVTKARDQSFLEIYMPKELAICSSGVSVTATQPRRAALHSRTSLPLEVPHLRSLLLLTRSSFSDSAYVSLEKFDLRILHSNFKLLRLLNLWGIRTASGVLPTQIGNLIHLRYLGIRASNITELPHSIANLRNLLTLDYRNVNSEGCAPIKIPNILWKLRLLRHLFLPVECHWCVEDLQLSTMENLQVLWGIKQDGKGNWLSRELSELSMTLKKLKIVVSTQKDLDAILSCHSLMFGRLHTLHCQLKDSVALRDVNQPLSHNQNLQKLKLLGKIEIKLSFILPQNLLLLELKDSMLQDEDPMLAIGTLAHLKILKLSNSYFGTTLACRPGSFPQLEELYLESLQNLDKWMIEKGAFPCLKKLEIVRCRRLQELPCGLEFVTTLQQLEFFEMPTNFCQKAVECGWSQQRLRLPYNYGSIIKHSDSSVDVSSIRKLYKHLTAGIFLDNKMKKYWVTKRDGSYTNCFMVYVTALTVRLWAKNHFHGVFTYFEDNEFWELSKMAERSSSDGTLITVAKLKLPVMLLGLLGSFNTEDLSPQVTYEVAYVVMLQGPRSGLEMTAECELSLPNRSIKKHEEKLDDKPMGDWIRVFVGEFETSSENIGQVQFSLHCDWPGLVIKGVVIEPKIS